MDATRRIVALTCVLLALGSLVAACSQEGQQVKDYWLEQGSRAGYSESEAECAWDELHSYFDEEGLTSLADDWTGIGLRSQLDVYSPNFLHQSGGSLVSGRDLGERVANCGIRN